MSATDPEIKPIVSNVKNATRAVDYYFVEIRGFSTETVAQMWDKTARVIRQNVQKAKQDLNGLEPVEPRPNNKNDPQESRLYEIISCGVGATPAVDLYMSEYEDMDVAAVAMVRGKQIATIDTSLDSARRQLGLVDDQDDEPEDDDE